MDIRKIKKLIELLDQSGVSEIEIKEGQESLRISRNQVVISPQNLPPGVNPQTMGAYPPVASQR